NRARNKGLSCRHHIDMRARGNKSRAFAATFVGAIKNRQMLLFEVRGPFKSHGTSDILIGFANLRFGETNFFEQIEVRTIKLCFVNVENVGAKCIAQCPTIEDESDVKS